MSAASRETECCRAVEAPAFSHAAVGAAALAPTAAPASAFRIEFFDWMLTATRLPSWKHKAARTAQARQSSASGALLGEL
jgi:hypothetical protein